MIGYSRRNYCSHNAYMKGGVPKLKDKNGASQENKFQQLFIVQIEMWS